MAESTGILKVTRKASHTARLEVRKEICEFRFSIENFELYEFNKEDGVPKELVSPTFITGGSGVPESKWCIKVRFLHDQNTKTVTDIDCIIYEASKFAPAPATFTSYIVASTGELKPFVKNNGKYGYARAALLKEAETLLPGGTLTVECHLSITYPANVKQSEKVFSQLTESSHLKNLQSDLRVLHENLQHSDVVLRCGDEDIKAHKCILSARSSVFAKMFEHDMKENQENVVVITDVSAEAIKAMLQHIYCGEIGELTTEMHLQLYSVANKYDLKDLKSASSKFIASHLTVDNICEAAILAHLHHDKELLETSKQFFTAHISDIIATPVWMGVISEYEVLAKELAKP